MLTLLLEEQADRVRIRLNRPDARNAINREMVAELHAVCDRLEAKPRIALISGADGIFAAGADIAELRERRRGDALAGINSGLFDRIRRLPMPTIALMDGPAIGGGAELAYACDFRIGTERTRIGNPEVSLGILAAAGATWRLVELVGEPIAKEILLAGRTLTAAEALEIRLLNEVVESEKLAASGEALADRIAHGAPLAVQLSKQAIDAPRSAHPLVDNTAQAVLFETDEKYTRMDRFLNRGKDSR